LREPHIKNQLIEWWGPYILDPSAQINRKKIAQIVFNDPVQRQKLEKLVHPWIEARRDEMFAQAPPGTKALVIDAPLLFEAGLDAMCDAVIFVDTPTQVRAARVLATRGWDTRELAQREDSQMPLDRKRQSADYVLANNGQLHDLERQVEQLLRTILETFPA
jgi:dephospho-CoA kinase